MHGYIFFALISDIVHCLNNHIMNGDIILDEFVQVYINGGFMPICWEESTRNDVANTVCKQLGLDGAKSTHSIRYMHAAIIIIYTYTPVLF